MTGSTLRETGHRKPQSLVKVPKELLQLQQKVCIGIDIFFVIGHIFFMMCSRKICFTAITHLSNHKVSVVVYALQVSYCWNSWWRRVCLDHGSSCIPPYHLNLEFGCSFQTCRSSQAEYTFSQGEHLFDPSFLSFWTYSSSDVGTHGFVDCAIHEYFSM